MHDGGKVRADLPENDKRGTLCEIGDSVQGKPGTVPTEAYEVGGSVRAYKKESGSEAFFAARDGRRESRNGDACDGFQFDAGDADNGCGKDGLRLKIDVTDGRLRW